MRQKFQRIDVDYYVGHVGRVEVRRRRFPAYVSLVFPHGAGNVLHEIDRQHNVRNVDRPTRVDVSVAPSRKFEFA